MSFTWPHNSLPWVLIPYSGFLAGNYIFVNNYLAGLCFGATDSAQKYVPIKIHFDE